MSQKRGRTSRDRSFAELSHFAHDGEGWRYLVGETRALRDAEGLSIAAWESGG